MNLARLLWFPLLRVFCGRLAVEGREHVPTGPVVFAANHSSHADTLAVLRALPRHQRRRTVVAAAEDYFFATRPRAALSRLAVGAFPFPRRGGAGVRRTLALLAGGSSVLLFPQGTRCGGPFRDGVARLAAAGATIVPVGIAGTSAVLPKGRRWPRRGRVGVAFAAAPEPARLEEAVTELAARAADLPPARRGTGMLFAWGFAEALVWPLIPDTGIAVATLAQPRSWARSALAALAGSVLGGALAATLTGGGVDLPQPLVTPRMREAAAGWLAEGSTGLWHQPLSGVPYKVFAAAAPAAGIGLLELAAMTAVVRGVRMLAVAAGSAIVGLLVRRRPRLRRALSAGTVTVVMLGLGSVVRAWS